MMQARECYLKADRCEAMARQCTDPLRSMLHETAAHWRSSAEAAGASQNPSTVVRPHQDVWAQTHTTVRAVQPRGPFSQHPGEPGVNQSGFYLQGPVTG